ncbi:MULTISPECIES: S1C family serine protease [Actinomycetaceae]|uniref:S1C family serine protease n=1 Tax=Actinomycetaceae TaxID=2049 RepID=UPI000397D1A3|nr:MULTISPECIES: trypsin-like peptidase domain-containing protein [Actinomycetaceae]ERH20978.1 serine protease do-like HtrA family protein [Actinomyces sp. oral taxon 172 str. F0311]WLD78394.1 trypsin-like peptidase domain-containing protein [Schaalia sp. HMT-172]
MNESQIPASGAAAAPDIPPATPATENPAPSAQDTPAADGTYSAPTGEPYGGYAAPASSEAVAPTVIVTKKGPGWGALLGAMLLTVGLTLGALFYVRPAMLRASTPTNLNGGTVATVPASSDATDWTAVASAVSPAVVTIQAQGASSGSTGSGVIYDAQGDIVTNYHVISSVLTGGQIQVTLADGRLYAARIVGHDKTTDLAVIRLDNPPEDLTVARFATSSTLQVGAPVMAIGAPLGLSNTVTTGIVSALNRPVEVSMDEDSTSQDQTQASSDLVITNAIQIDASINPGNSGGPLFDATGAVVGINSSIKSLATSSDGQAGSIGLGFAIPSDLVVSVADQLIASGSASHGMLGVTVKAATATVGSDTYVGAEIQEVTSGSGAAIAGLRVGDVILTVEGQEVTSPKQLVGYVRRYRAGDTVTMTIERDGATQDVSVTIQ